MIMNNNTIEKNIIKETTKCFHLTPIMEFTLAKLYENLVKRRNMKIILVKSENNSLADELSRNDQYGFYEQMLNNIYVAPGIKKL